MDRAVLFFSVFFYLLTIASSQIVIKVDERVSTGPAVVTWTRKGTTGPLNPTSFALHSIVFGFELDLRELVQVETGDALSGTVDVTSNAPGPHLILAYQPGTEHAISASNIFEVVGEGKAVGSIPARTVTATSTRTATVTSLPTLGASAAEETTLLSPSSRPSQTPALVVTSLLTALFAVSTVVLVFMLRKARKQEKRNVYLESASIPAPYPFQYPQAQVSSPPHNTGYPSVISAPAPAMGQVLADASIYGLYQDRTDAQSGVSSARHTIAPTVTESMASWGMSRHGSIGSRAGGGSGYGLPANPRSRAGDAPPDYH